MQPRNHNCVKVEFVYPFGVLRMFNHAVLYAFDLIKHGTRTFQISVVLLFIYIAWWIWAFKLLPKLRPQEPRMFPYWVPVLGHTVSFFRNTNGTITQARTYFANTRRPFTLLLGGQTLHVLTSAQDVSEAYKNTTQLTFDEYVRGMLSIFIKDQAAVARMYTSPPEEIQKTNRPRFPNPKQVCIAHLGESVLVRQLSGGEHAIRTETAALQMIDERLTWQFLPGKATFNLKSHCKVLSLKDLCQDVLLQCSSRAFFGNALMDHNSRLVQDFLEFDDESWKLNYRVPALLSRGMNRSLEAIRMAFTRYIDLPDEAKQDASWMVPIIENELHGIGLSSYDKASFFISLFWSANSNSWRLVFWMIAYILHSPELHQKIRKEVSPHVTGSDSPAELVAKLQTCKWLMAAYHETLRLTISSTSVRRVRESCIIGNKTLQKDAQVIIPYRQMLMDGRVFGSDASNFDPARFVKNPALLNDASYRPFGGGVTYCPGRHIALKEALLAVSLLVGRFRLKRLNSGSSFPQMDEAKPCVGVMSPSKNADICMLVEES